MEQACMLAGINHATWQRWARAASDGDAAAERFVRDVKAAVAQRQASLIGVLDDAAQGRRKFSDSPQWRAGAWLLERVHGYERRGVGSSVEVHVGQPQVEEVEVVEVWDPNEPPSAKVERRVRRLYRQLADAERSANHAAVASLMRQAAIAEAELRRLTTPEGEGEPGTAMVPANIEEEAFVAELRFAAEGMPEQHLRVFAEAWLERHRLLAVSRDPAA